MTKFIQLNCPHHIPCLIVPELPNHKLTSLSYSNQNLIEIINIDRLSMGHSRLQRHFFYAEQNE